MYLIFLHPATASRGEERGAARLNVATPLVGVVGLGCWALRKTLNLTPKVPKVHPT
jgi:hypothetical protein